MWIDVTIERPPFLRKVLFHWLCPGGNRNLSMGYLCEQGWDIYLPYHSYKLHNERILVTHWMDLPEYPTMVFEESEPLGGSLTVKSSNARFISHLPTVEGVE